MENKNNTGLVVLVTILSLLVLGLGGYLVYDKFLDKNNTENNQTNDNNVGDNITNRDNNQENNTTYKLGDVVTLSKIHYTFYDKDLSEQYSKWYVLEEKDGYVKLYSNNSWSGKGTLNDIGLATSYVYNNLRESGYNVESVRQLNEEELKLFDCTVDYQKLANTIKSHDGNKLTKQGYSYIKLNNNEVRCNNLPKFIYENTSLPYTDVKLFGYTLSIGNQFTLHIHNQDALVGTLHPVIIIPISEIE